MQTVKVLHDQTIYDIAVQVYGNIQGVFWLMEDNPDVISDLDVDLLPGTELKVDLSKKKTILINRATPAPAIKSKYVYDKVTPGQSIYDLSMQYLGSVDGLFNIIKDLGLQSVDDALPAGLLVMIDTTNVKDSQTAKRVSDKTMRFNTHEESDFDGVEFWGIEIDFIVE